MSRPKITVVGSCNIDLITYTDVLPKPGETLFGTDFKKGFGGKGANQAVMVGKLGGDVTMISKLGKDSFATETLENFKEFGISADHVGITDKAASGIATIIVDSKGMNIIIVASGANMLVSESDIHSATDVIANSKILICQLEVPLPATIAALKIAKSKGVTTVFNPAPAQKSLPDELYGLCDIFCPNETETEILTGIEVKDVADANKAAQVLLNRGAKNVIITLGEKGSVWVKEGQEPKYVPAEKVEKVNDTTGAGDCYIGSLAFYLANGKPMEEAMLRATQICAKKVQGFGTQTSYPTMKDLPNEFHI